MNEIEHAKQQVEAALASLFAAQVALGAALGALEAAGGQSPAPEPGEAPEATQPPLLASPLVPPGHPDSNELRDRILTMGQPTEEIRS